MEQERAERCVGLGLLRRAVGSGMGLWVSQRTQQAEAVAHPRGAVGECIRPALQHTQQPPPVWRGSEPPLQPPRLFQGRQQGQGSSASPGRERGSMGGGAELRILILLCQELASCCTASITDKFGTGGMKSQIKRSWTERRTAEPRVSLCSWASFFPHFSSSPWHRVLLFLVFPQSFASIPRDHCGNLQTKTTLEAADSVLGHGAKSEGEPAKGREKKKDGLRKKTCHLERDKLRCSKEDGRVKKEGEQGCFRQLWGSKALGRRKEAFPALPLLEMQI